MQLLNGLSKHKEVGFACYCWNAVFCCVCVCFNRAYIFYVAVDDVRAEMRHLNVGPDLLSEIFKRFRDNRVMYFHILVYHILVWNIYISLSRHNVHNSTSILSFFVMDTIFAVYIHVQKNNFHLHLCLHLKTTFRIGNFRKF